MACFLLVSCLYAGSVCGCLRSKQPWWCIAKHQGTSLHWQWSPLWHPHQHMSWQGQTLIPVLICSFVLKNVLFTFLSKKFFIWPFQCWDILTCWASPLTAPSPLPAPHTPMSPFAPSTPLLFPLPPAGRPLLWPFCSDCRACYSNAKKNKQVMEATNRKTYKFVVEIY